MSDEVSEEENRPSRYVSSRDGHAGDPEVATRPVALVVEDSPGFDLLQSFDALLSSRHTGPYAAWAERHIAEMTISQQREVRRFPYAKAFEVLIPVLSQPKETVSLLRTMAALPLPDYLRIAITSGPVAPDTPLESERLLALVESPTAARAFIDTHLAATGRWRNALLDLLACPEEARRTLLTLLATHAEGAFAEIAPELALVRAQAAARLREVVKGGLERWPSWLGPYGDLAGFSPVVLAASGYLGTSVTLYYHEISHSLLDAIPDFEPFIFIVGAQRALSPTEIGPRGLSTLHGAAPPDRDARLAAVYAALGDATRLRLLWLLAERPYFGQELASALGVAVPTSWRHLRILERAGLVSIQRRARRTYYVLRAEAVAHAVEAVDRMLVHPSRGEETSPTTPRASEEGTV